MKFQIIVAGLSMLFLGCAAQVPDDSSSNEVDSNVLVQQNEYFGPTKSLCQDQILVKDGHVYLPGECKTFLWIEPYTAQDQVDPEFVQPDVNNSDFDPGPDQNIDVEQNFQ